jgi:hypothetical protein
MSTLVASYSHDMFLKLDGPKEQHVKQKQIADMSALRTVFRSHGLQDACGLALLHRHYHADADEILVETITPDNSKTTPVKVTAAPKVIPHVWRLHEGRWYPLEFLNVSGDHEKIRAAEAFHHRVVSNEVFLKEVAEALKGLGLQDLFGLQLNHRDIMLRKHPSDTILETTDVPARISSIVNIPLDQKQPEVYVDTFFGFGCEDLDACAKERHHACGWTACAYGCCSDY